MIADGGRSALTQYIEEFGYPIQYIDANSNLGSLKIQIELSKQVSGDVYFLEDDYLHYGNVVEALEEGLSMSEYATLYDHPDKYSSLYNFGEQTILSRKNYHWKQTISTTMTFASRVGTLKDDYGCFFKQTRNFHPNDHEIFLEINKKSKKLISCVPGMSIHTDLTVYSNMDKPYIDKWVSYV